MLLGFSVYLEIEKGIYPTLFVLIPALVFSMILLWSPRKRLQIPFALLFGGSVFILVRQIVQPPILSVEDIRLFAGLTSPWNSTEFWQDMPLIYKIWAFAYPALTLLVMALSVLVVMRVMGDRKQAPPQTRAHENTRTEAE